MTYASKQGSVVTDWHLCKDGKEYFSKIQHKKNRKVFGLLEAPVMPPHVPMNTVHYKVFLSGKSGVGKTSLAARLAGLEIPSMHYETTGIETTVIYWPVKLKESSRVLFFRFQLWDCGETALRRFDHLLPSCRERVDAVLFLFSFTDRTSFDDLPNQITKWNELSGSPVATLVVGTKYDLFMHCDVSDRDMEVFQETWQLPVLRTGSGEDSNGLNAVAPLLDSLAECLWRQDCTAGSAS
ncbi:ciliogenesis and planar polarity effector 2 [Corythoichthys intestinalis]|uniref:ciliogenesis and planar polarity effector 2 n=1 Tax=Corythoichthys intestinalis TaxID=161448 RepID=UPI0025A53093|nr:ciliogenesis and planar polarity effector 2 [Corythoichthys intestinalis]